MTSFEFVFKRTRCLFLICFFFGCLYFFDQTKNFFLENIFIFPQNGVTKPSERRMSDARCAKRMKSSGSLLYQDLEILLFGPSTNYCFAPSRTTSDRYLGEGEVAEFSGNLAEKRRALIVFLIASKRSLTSQGEIFVENPRKMLCRRFIFVYCPFTSFSIL